VTHPWNYTNYKFYNARFIWTINKYKPDERDTATEECFCVKNEQIIPADKKCSKLSLHENYNNSIIINPNTIGNYILAM